MGQTLATGPRRTAVAAAVAAAALLSLAVVTGCSSSDDAGAIDAGGPAPASASAPGTPSTGQTTSATAQASPVADDVGSPAWVDQTDQATGVSFSLPYDAQPQTRTQQLADGTPVTVTLYPADVDAEQLAVTVLSGDADLSTYDSLAIYRGMVAGLKQAGSTDAKLSAIGRGRIDGRASVDATITFTSTKGDQRNYWRIGTVATGSAVVTVQALTFVDAADLPAAAASIDAAFAQLERGIKLG